MTSQALTRGAKVYALLDANPAGATWQDLAAHLGITWAHHALDTGYGEVRAALTQARILAKLQGKVIPRPTPDTGYRYRLEEKVGNDPFGFDGTYGGWVRSREDLMTRQRTLVDQAQVLLDSGSLAPVEQRRLRRQQAKDVGRLVELEDDAATFQRAFRRRNGATP